MIRRPRRAGITLVEILLVMAIILALGAIAYPTLSAMYGDVRIKAAADEVRAAWTEARAQAIEEGRPYRFSIEPETGKFRVAPDAGEFWDGSGGGPSDDSAPPPHIQEGTLPNGIVFDVSADLPSDGTWTTVVVFNPDGTCASDVEVILKEDDDSTPVVVRVRAMTGAVSVRKKSSGDR
ncbi:MAG: GspH/FimT family pseudopilin [Zavarzinella sp.]|nr:GspH/FimT family pseudopilin [Zavarzinella sp.]